MAVRHAVSSRGFHFCTVLARCRHGAGTVVARCLHNNCTVLAQCLRSKCAVLAQCMLDSCKCTAPQGACCKEVPIAGLQGSVGNVNSSVHFVVKMVCCASCKCKGSQTMFCKEVSIAGLKGLVANRNPLNYLDASVRCGGPPRGCVHGAGTVVARCLHGACAIIAWC